MTPASPTLSERTPSARRTLGRCRALVRPCLVTALDRLHPATRRLAVYACGLEEAGRAPAGGGGGKGVRPALALLAGEAVGGGAEAALPAAVATELLHTFSLIHDDILDEDEWRRHRPTVWKAFGTGPAVLAGDALFALAVETVSTSGAGDCAQALRLLCAALDGLMRGQAQDLQFEQRPWRGGDAVLPEEYRAMVGDKTGALFGGAVALGALLAGAGPGPVAAFGAAGRQLGLAFQIVDDVLGIWGDPRRTGKPVGSDLRRGKKTLPVVAVLAEGGAAARRLAGLLEAGELDDAGARAAAALLEEAGGRSLALAEGRLALTRAYRTLAEVPLVPRAWRELTALADFLVERAG
ncbi:polyprenyl synthetase family protein [Streptomyces hoynatensis]|uniref:Polyprenyl synthetase family protein n=1 Tax=Streptomyces hoynatensis TaxID=1141874 RepID=A0A3A9YZR2_9ACTN|nr:polyprenyl synthetase family protein [Streptomyces hoynatensis]RKN41229.1 polyprenyl synthetase family protein [Streptomyces hoynatensis]